MSNDTDDTMRRIDIALNTYATLCYLHAGPAKTREARDDVVAAIRAALQPVSVPYKLDAGGWGEDDDRHRANEEHERAVEAWGSEFTSGAIGRLAQHPFLTKMRDEALRLMRRQPTVQKPTNPSTVSSSETTNTETTDGK